MTPAYNPNSGILTEVCFIGVTLNFPRTKVYVTDLFSMQVMQAAAAYAYCDASDTGCSSNCCLSVGANPDHIRILILESEGMFFF